ncbi:MAG: hypothetical protein B7Y25_00070 [Alphaproteobacteria bacterium 16-39-46]|nr:MAG: hypothetical protein B7Y25_00070 [Alphaproteobacteria bacterium 16-39-46]OZA44547.1 MAG: hypothetical protein B7X84_00250 [Alphaproteobacteria bacterium 17-39-52]HQS83396.1 MFS transporter [Alphaproteobacteria bacterium]HQS93083.1 MFS transporter [Alphaproteobacteria bacterium]
MKNLSEFSQKTLRKYGIINQRDFYYLILIISILSCIGGLTATFVNLDIHQVPRFKGEITSWNFIMPCLGGFLGTFFFPRVHKFFSLKIILRFSLIGILINYVFMIFLMNSFFNFPIRFLTGFFYSPIFLAISCLEAKIFGNSYRATLFGIVGVQIVLFSSLGSSLVDFFQTSAIVFGIDIGGLLICLALLWKWKDLSEVQSLKTDPSPKTPHPSYYKIFSLAPIICLSFFVVSSVDTGFGSYLAIFCEGLGLREGKAALVYSFSSLGGLALMPIAGRVADKWGYKKTFLLLSFLGLFGAASSFFLTQLYTLAFAFFVASAAMQSFANLISSWVARNYAGKTLSYGMSTFSLLGSTSSILSPLGIGFLMKTYGNDGFLYWACGGLFTSVILMIALNTRNAS